MRPSWDEHFLKMSRLVSEMSTCARRNVGCILIDDRNQILSTGFNGVPPHFPHCNENNPCPGAQRRSGSDLDLCYAVHAEQNALMRCSDIRKIRTCYLTTSPCVTCTKLLLGTSCTRIIFIEEYANVDESQRLWNMNPPLSGREWIHYDLS